jgi:hypothetical protein
MIGSLNTGQWWKCSTGVIFDRRSIIVSIIVLIIIGLSFFSFLFKKQKFEIQEISIKNETEIVQIQPEIVHPIPPTHVQEEKPNKKIHFHTIIALGVVSRFKENKQVDYLTDAVNSLDVELKSYKKQSGKENFLVYVQNNDKINYPIGYQKLKYDKNLKEFFKFRTVKDRYNDPFKDIPGHDYQHPNNVLPGHLARQQVCDVISIIDYVLENYNFKYLLFMEDDFVACKGLIQTIVVNSGNLQQKDEKFCGLRISYGMSGIVLKRKDLMKYREWAQSIINMFDFNILKFSQNAN